LTGEGQKYKEDRFSRSYGQERGEIMFSTTVRKETEKARFILHQFSIN
jgi:hypothetical protein